MREHNKDKGFLDDVIKKQKNVDVKIKDIPSAKEKKRDKNTTKNDDSLKKIAYGKSKYELKDIKKPSISSQIRIASDMDQAILKFISYGSGYLRAYKMMRYISRKFELKMEDQEGNEITEKSEANELLKSWSSMYFDTRKNSRDVAHVMFSAPHGTERNIFKKAVREFLHEQYHGNHDYVFVAHEDTEHPHVHSLLSMRSVKGKKLDPRKKYIHGLRTAFAKKCREHGIMVDASYRFERGIPGKSLNSKMYNMRQKRKETPESDHKLIQKIKKELTQNLKNDEFFSAKKFDMKQHFYDTAKKVYEQSKEKENPKDIENNVKAAKLLYDFSRRFDKQSNRYDDIKTVIKDIEKLSVEPSKEVREILKNDIEDEL